MCRYFSSSFLFGACSAEHAVQSIGVEIQDTPVGSECIGGTPLLHEHVTEQFLRGQSRSRRDGVLRRRGLDRSGLLHQIDARLLLAARVGNPGTQLETKHLDVVGKDLLARRSHCSFERCQPVHRRCGQLLIVQMRGPEAASEMRDGLGPGESIPVERRRFARHERDRFAPGVPLQRIASRRRSQMKCSLERRLQIASREQPTDLGSGLVVHALLQIRIDEVLDGVRKLVPHEIAVLADGMLQRRRGCLQIA